MVLSWRDPIHLVRLAAKRQLYHVQKSTSRGFDLLNLPKAAVWTGVVSGEAGTS
jgi:hypothetical protein